MFAYNFIAPVLQYRIISLFIETHLLFIVEWNNIVCWMTRSKEITESYALITVPYLYCVHIVEVYTSHVALLHISLFVSIFSDLQIKIILHVRHHFIFNRIFLSLHNWNLVHISHIYGSIAYDNQISFLEMLQASVTFKWYRIAILLYAATCSTILSLSDQEIFDHMWTLVCTQPEPWWTVDTEWLHISRTFVLFNTNSVF